MDEFVKTLVGPLIGTSPIVLILLIGMRTMWRVNERLTDDLKALNAQLLTQAERFSVEKTALHERYEAKSDKSKEQLEGIARDVTAAFVAARRKAEKQS